MLTLATGTGIAQAIPIAISPILTRIYSPDDFGIFAIYMSIASIFSVVSTGRYELAIILPKKEEDAINLMALSLIISSIISFIVLLIVIIFNAHITTLLGSPDISNWLYFIPFTILFTGFYQSFTNWVTRKKKFKALAVNKVIRNGTTGIANIGLGFNGFGGGGLILSSIVGQALATFMLVKVSVTNRRFLIKDIEKVSILKQAKKHRKFPIFNALHALVNTVFSQMPIFILSRYFYETSVGFYSLSLRIIQTPILILGASFASVLYEKITFLRNNNENYMTQIYKFLRVQIILGLILVSAIFISSNFMDVIFGDSWLEVGLYIKLLLPWLFMVFVVSPLAFSVNLTNNQEKGLLLEWVFGFLRLGSLLLGALYFEDIKLTLILFSVTNAMFLVYQGFWFVNLLKKEEL